MIQLNNFHNNPNIIKTAQMGCFEVYEHQKDLSVSPRTAQTDFFMHQMNLRKRQVMCNLNGNSIKMQAGAMQWMAGGVSMDSGVKGAKDFFGKALKSLVTNESVAKPIYQGNGYVMLEPTYRFILLEDVASWGSGIVIEDGMFLACDASVKEEVISRSSVSSAVLGGEGLFNLALSGQGALVLESSVPREELIEIVLDNDEVKIDGNMAIAWSKSLQFSIEKSTKSALGSMVSGEGLVNVYRGSGKIWMAPTAAGTLMSSSNAPDTAKKSTSDGLISSIFG